MFAGTLLKTFWYLYKKQWKWKLCQNDSSKLLYVGMKSGVYLSIACKLRPTSKNIVFTKNIHYLIKGTDFEGVIL